MPNSLTPKLLPLLLISFIWFCIGWFVKDQFATVTRSAPLTPDAERLLTAFQLLTEKQILTDTALLTTTDTARVEAAIDGMLAWSQDPFADLYGPTASVRYQMGVEGEIGQSNIWYNVFDGKYVVTAVPAGSAADKAGVQVGDILLSADGIEFGQNISPYEARILQRGPVGSTLHLTIQRQSRLLSLQIVREEWQTLSSNVLTQQIGYLNTQFFFLDYSEERIKKLLEELLAQKIQALIWDLRGSTGGSVPVVQQVLSYFIAQGTLFTAEFRDGTIVPFAADNKQFVDAQLPVILLIDKETLSASEIAAAVMSARKRAKLIGTETAGKGMIQETVPLDEGYMLRYSVAKWVAPPLEWTEGQGVQPDIYLADDPTTEKDEVLDFAINYISDTYLQ